MILCVSLAALLCSLSHKLGGIHDHRPPPCYGQHFISSTFRTIASWRKKNNATSKTSQIIASIHNLYSFLEMNIKVRKLCCDVLGQISILLPAVFLQTLLFRSWGEFFKSRETHLWNLHTLSSRAPPYHTFCFHIYTRAQEQSCDLGI